MTSTVGTAAFPTDSTDIARQPLVADQCALIVVDIQEKLLPPIFNKDELVKNSRLLLRAANILKMPVVVTTQYAQGLGPVVPEIASLVGNVRTIDKLEFGCFGSNEFRISAEVAARQSQYRAALWHGGSHLRDADRAGSAE